MRRYLIALLAAAVIIGGMFALQSIMTMRMDYYVHAGVVIPLSERLLFALAVYWRAFWWLLTPFILFGCLGLAALLHLLSSARKSS